MENRKKHRTWIELKASFFTCIKTNVFEDGNSMKLHVKSSSSIVLIR